MWPDSPTGIRSAQCALMLLRGSSFGVGPKPARLFGAPQHCSSQLTDTHHFLVEQVN
ncbi:hypothetical protein [Polycyclovorans algicola]|uniref:hypothetical protein n=1 Tax=Polycyclovorans algicola TaxID=616992 RepID=UPI001377F9A6|nr:hypothetical protein [Polycyclovorans algicola]